jgi:hypothetical protein
MNLSDGMNAQRQELKALVDGGTHLRLTIPMRGAVWLANSALPGEAGPVYALRLAPYQQRSRQLLSTKDFLEAWQRLEDEIERLMEGL